MWYVNELRVEWVQLLKVYVVISAVGDLGVVVNYRGFAALAGHASAYAMHRGAQL